MRKRTGNNIFKSAWLFLVLFFMSCLINPGIAYAYTPPAPLAIIWSGTDQSATCHDYEDYITNVSFAGINHNDSSNGWHIDYGRTTTQIAPGEVTIGQSYDLSVTVTGEDFDFHYVAVYIDWNQNNVASQFEANEEVAVWNNYTGSGSRTHTKRSQSHPEYHPA